MAELDPVGTKQKNPRRNRKKRRRSESTSSEEEWFSSDESIREDKIIEDQEEQNFASGPWTYDLDMVLLKEEFQIKDMCREMNASDFTIEYVLENGLEEPVLFRDSLSSLGMKMPKDGTLTARCVLKAVGDRLVEVVDVMTQGSRKMMLSDFVDYYESPPAERKDLLNLLSLEFSLTSLSKKVRGPALAMEIDWVELYWPKHLRNSPSTFPKVQNYCLMSVKRSFTDFHIDFGGTSVWYHIYKGRKIFWIVEPTEENIVKYEKWILEGTQHEVFFGDLVDKCARIELYEGCTFLIPSGWIHAVYTPEDSLVFGGNFLHSFSIPMQLRIIRSENILAIKEKYRYPSYMEMVWYVIENIVKKATSRSDETKKTSEDASGSIDKEVDNNASGKEVGKSADGVMIHVNSLAKDATTDVKKETDCDIIRSATEVKEVTVDSAAIQDKPEEREGDESGLKYNDEYLSTISKKEREGFKSLLIYMREIVSSHKDSADQEKTHLLDVFEQVLDHGVPERFVVEKERERNVEQQHSPKLNEWLESFGRNKPLISKRKISPKEKVIEMQQFSRPKPSKSKVKNNKKPDYHKPDGPLIVGGIPPAIMPAGASQAPNPYGYDPLASVTPLGHKQLPSAYRRTPDMAKVPPSQKFRLQPQLYKVIAAASDKMEAVPVKVTDKSWSANVTAVGPSNANNSAEYEFKTAAVAPADIESSAHRNEAARPHHNRNKDNQRNNRHTAKEEYPELQYRSPLVRPGPSNKRTSVAAELGHDSYRCRNKAFKRRYTDSFLTADRWSSGKSSMRRAGDCYTKRNESSTFWRPELHHLSKRSPAAEVASIKDPEEDKNFTILQPTGVIEQRSSRSEHGTATVKSPSPTESHGSAVVQFIKFAEFEKPEIRDLSLTLNNDKEESAEIVTATEELAELTKVFDVDERDSKKEWTGPLMVTNEQRKPKRQSLSSSEKIGDIDQYDSSPVENLKEIPTETVLQNLSSLTAEFNAVVD